MARLLTPLEANRHSYRDTEIPRYRDTEIPGLGFRAIPRYRDIGIIPVRPDLKPVRPDPKPVRPDPKPV